MASKDWQKRKSRVPGHSFEAFNSKKNGVLWVQKIRGKSVYYVNVSYFSSGLGRNFVNKRFETKIQAMNFAKRYMSKN